jgi:hypothetical protein
MRSEASKSLRSGFDLTEQELRRIYEALVQQMDRVITSEAPDLKTSFEIKFRNGVIAEPTNLNEILDLENIGSGKIERLKMRVEKGTEISKTRILLEFINIDSDSETGNDAISYSIIGSDRDWVFITSSQLEERISRIKKFAPNQLLQKKRTALLSLQLFILLPLSLGMLMVAYVSSEYRKNVLLEQINAIESAWKSGQIKDPIEVVLEISKLQVTHDPSSPLFNWEDNRWYILMIIAFGALLGLGLFWVYFFPFYNFLWGDYVKVYEKKKAIGKFIIGGIILTLVISMIANYFSAILGVGK